MSRSKIFFSLCLFIVSYAHLFAQYNYDAEAIQFSLYEYKGTARTAGVAGAFSTVGPDVGAITLNPAVVGMYRSSEASGTLNFQNSNAKSSYLEKTSKENHLKVTANHLSVVFATSMESSKSSGVLRGLGFSISTNRIIDFNNQIYFEGKNYTNSIVDQYVYFMNLPQYINLPVDYSSFPADYVLAKESGLVNYSDLYKYYSSAAGGGKSNYQTGFIKTSGGITDMSVAIGANLWDKLYVGGSFGIPYLTYKRQYNYTEEDRDDSISGFKKLEYSENYQTQGIGYNGKIGVIYKPTKLVRVGVSISTPTYFGLKETYGYTMKHTTDSSVLSVESPSGAFQYSYKQPYRVNAGASVFFDQYGFFSVDYEMVNYALNKYNFGTQYRDQSAYYNDTLIRNKYKISHQIRSGVELAYKTGRIRFGYAYQFSPFKKGVAVENANLSKHLISAGLGYKGRRFSVDIAYVHTISRSYFAPYISVQSYPSYEDGVTTKTSKDNILLTLGFKFK